MGCRQPGDCVEEKIFCSFQEPNRDSPIALPTGLLLYQLRYRFLALLLKIYLLFHILIGIYVLQLVFISSSYSLHITPKIIKCEIF
jgi:hypothetical protein